jgi:hypothetical protein
MATVRFTVDGKRVSVNADPSMPLLSSTPPGSGCAARP